MAFRSLSVVVLAISVLLCGCKNTQELPPVYLLRANVHDKCIATLREALKSDEFWPSVHAAEGLIDAGYSFDAVPVLIEKLASETQSVYRAGLASALIRSGQKEAITILQDILLGSDEIAKEEAVKGMFHLATVADTSVVQHVVRSTGNQVLSIYASALLHVTEKDKKLNEIRDALAADDSAVRVAASDIIPIIGSSDPDTTRLLVNLNNASADLESFYTIRALAMMNHSEARTTLIQFTRHQDPSIRQKAAYALAESWVVEEIDLLYALLEDPSLAVRVRAAHALLILNDSGSIYRLMRIR